MNRGYDSSRILLGEFLPTCQVEGFTVGSPVLNDPYFQSFCFEEFDVSCGSCFMAGKQDLSCRSIPIGILACDSHGQMCRCRWIGDTARNFIEIGGRFSSSFPQDTFVGEMDDRDAGLVDRKGGNMC